MEKLPIELHKKIYQVACLDGWLDWYCRERRFTLRTRSLTEYRYQSVALNGSRQISLFQNAFAELRQSKPFTVVLHLYVCQDIGDPIVAGLTPEDDDVGDPYPATIPALAHLLPLVEHTLETLSIVAPSVCWGHHRLLRKIGGPAFPKLQELTVCGDVEFRRSGLPQLERLHLVGNRLAVWFRRDLFQPTFLQLTHLRITHCEELWPLAETWIAGAGFIGIIKREEYDQLVTRFNHPTHGIPALPTPLPERCDREAILETQAEFRGQIDQIKREVPWFFDKYGDRLWLEISCALESGFDIAEAAPRVKTEWLERLQGKAGCWSR